ncbi:adenosylcobinamide-GDP ribazoletransferase [Chromatium weissei]|nr:adenosylcobinamide-GDP ribazoletransferase [Chromatium weissei]
MNLRPLWIAGRFLTRLPFPDHGVTTAAEVGQSVLWYPFIGLLLGGVITSVAWLTTGAESSVAAAMVLIAWVWSSGAIHLDGSADSADGWVGGLVNRERTLEIMKDPRCGSMGVTVIALILIAKFAGLQALLAHGDDGLLLWLPLLGRVQLPLLLLTTRYARSHGMAFEQARYLPRRAGWLVVSVVLIGAVLMIGTMQNWTMAATLALVTVGILLVMRRAMLQRLAGFTGDTAGAVVEMTEMTLLLILSGNWT